MTGRSGRDLTLADVLNGLTFDGSHDELRPAQPPQPHQNCEPPQHAQPGRPAQWLRPARPGRARHAHQPEWQGDEPEPEAAGVRPYTWTRGRTRSSLELRVETLVSVRPEPHPRVLAAEHRTIAGLCRGLLSVAEVAVGLGVPLGVAKVLISDMVEAGLLAVHGTADTGGAAAHVDLMERVLSGLRRL